MNTQDKIYSLVQSLDVSNIILAHNICVSTGLSIAFFRNLAEMFSNVNGEEYFSGVKGLPKNIDMYMKSKTVRIEGKPLFFCNKDMSVLISFVSASVVSVDYTYNGLVGTLLADRLGGFSFLDIDQKFLEKNTDLKEKVWEMLRSLSEKARKGLNIN